MDIGIIGDESYLQGEVVYAKFLFQSLYQVRARLLNDVRVHFNTESETIQLFIFTEHKLNELVLTQTIFL
jgi:hypothetical protein